MTHHYPAPFERLRLWAARKLLTGRPGVRLALMLVPKNHPWRWWYESQADLSDVVTENSLHPRPRPTPLGLIPVSRPPAVSRAVFRYAMVSWAIMYLAVADFVSFLPGLGLVEPDPVTPLTWVGLADEPVSAPNVGEVVRRMVDAAG